jgi:exopolysaccharide production protein ExoZ
VPRPDPSLRQTAAAATVLPIQYLRGIAAMMVVWHHALNQLPGLKELFPSEVGSYGVDLFFVISGFIMVVTTSRKSVTPARFVVRRLVRIVPLYWILTLAAAGLALAAPVLFRSTQVSAGHLLSSLFFIPHWSPTHPGTDWPLVVPGWSLNYEMFFYVIFALALFGKVVWRAPVIIGTLMALVGLGMALGPSESAVVQSYTSPLLLEFAAGVALAVLWLRGHWAPARPLRIAAVAAGAALLAFDASVGRHWLLPAVASLLIVFGCLYSTRLASTNPIGLALGDSSYSIYLSHLFALGLLRWVWIKAPPAGSVGAGEALAFMGVALLVCAVAGWVLYRCAEKPMTNFLNRYAESKMPRSLAA